MITAARLAVGWGSVAAVFLAGRWLGGLAPAAEALLFAVMLAVILWSAFGVVAEADHLADVVKEPFGTLILTLAIVVIEVTLISAVMLGGRNNPTLGRDTMFAVLMIVLNGIVGLALLVGGIRYGEQRYNLQGASAYLAVIIPLSVIAVPLPNFTRSTEGGTLSRAQEVAFSAFTLGLYAIFIFVQTGRHRAFFADLPATDAPAPTGPPVEVAATGSAGIARHAAILILSVLPIVLLSKKLAVLLDHGLRALGAPEALGGVLIALIVLAPEGVSALRAVSANRLQRGVNLCLGAAASTIGLTVPAVIAVSLVSDQTIVLGLPPAEMIMLATTLILCTLTFSGTRTTVLEGAMHLVVFLVYITLVFSP